MFENLKIIKPGPNIQPSANLIFSMRGTALGQPMLGDPGAPGHPPGKPIDFHTRWSGSLPAGQPQPNGR
jgi:hypothetical protein